MRRNDPCSCGSGKKYKHCCGSEGSSSSSSPACDDAVEFHNQGVDLYLQGNLQAAESAFRQAIALDENDVNFWHGLGNVLYHQGRYKEAESAYRQAIALDESRAAFWHGLGSSLSHQGRYQEAESAFRQAIDLDENIAVFWKSLGLTLEYQNRKKEAFASYQRHYYLLPPQDIHRKFFRSFLIKLADEFDAPLILQRILKENPFFYKQPVLSLRIRLALAPYKNVLFFHEGLVATNLQNPSHKTLQIEGLITYYLGDSVKACEVFNQIVDQSDKDLFDQYYLLATLDGYCENISAALQQALQDVESFLRNSPGDPVQIYYAGQILHIAEQDERAVECFTSAIDKDENFLPAYYDGVLTYDRL